MTNVNFQTMEWIKRVKQHAVDNYETDGWDVLVECWDDDDIRQFGCPAGNYDEFFHNVHETVKVIDDRRRDVQGEIF